ncbi:CvpA family protein [Leeuwenhoekiella sp. A16]|uniref:CvpA family protein n=1 Tax=unclassified Leeuwenhoekiella TaxID=2615029 RepID=UPI003A7FAC2C|tara:strand:- start:38987 stop:39529 length:543 start_codon:yes stop_codon:yes gene_type:complete
MNYLDIIIGIFLLLGLIKGLKNGFFVELASLIALIAGIYGAIHFSYYAVDFLRERVSWSENTINLASFAITFIIIVIIISLAGKILTKIADFAMLGLVNRILGGIFGILKAAFIISVIIMFIAALNDRVSFIDEDVKNESILYQNVEMIAPMMLPNILKEVEEYKQEKESTRNTDTEDTE